MTILALEYIESTPNIFSGRPRIRGRRVAVEHIAVLHNGGWSADKIVDELELTPEEVYAALSYYYSHKDGIDQLIRDADTLARREARSLDELLGRLKSSDYDQK